MRLLITGANGFIGSYLVNYLNRNKYAVIAAVRKSTGDYSRQFEEVEIIELDVLAKEQLNSINISADVIIHTATANDIISKDPVKGIELSSQGTQNILEFAGRNGISKCIIFSTFQVYGTELIGEISEDSPLFFQNEYGLNHRMAELYGELYTRQAKVQCVSVRPSNVYGEIVSSSFNRWSLVPGCFCKEAFESGTITIKSSGKQMRNFVNLENLSKAIEAIVNAFPGRYECYNLASSQVFTMAEVASIVKSVYEREFNREIIISIEGELPKESNLFSTNLSKLEKIGFKEDQNFDLPSAVHSIFNYLKLKHH